MRIDLKKHRIVGAVIGYAVALLAVLALVHYFPVDPMQAIQHALIGVLAGTAAAYVAGWLKEYAYDKSGRGTVDADDLRYTWVGGLMGAIPGALTALAYLGALQ